ncbi:MAG: putative peptidoglycan glycosyltransferase FtsW [Actinomycetota bacterium]|nr:putative peptidoglycan glycosyltransferase FtsW [Actinomycetota bacterium]
MTIGVATRNQKGRILSRISGWVLKILDAENGFGPDSHILVVLIGVLTAIGISMVLSTSFVPSLVSGHNPFSLFEKQMLWVLLGLVAFGIGTRLELGLLLRYRGIPILLSGFALVAVLIPHVGVSVGGSSRWLGVGILRVQPSEVTKLAIAIFVAGVATARADQIHDWRKVLRPVILATGVAAFLILVEPDMGTAMVVGATAIGILFVSGVRMRHLLPTLVLISMAGLYEAMAKSYRRDRLLSFIHPWQNRSNFAYQEVQSLVAFATGHITGAGPGAGQAKWGFLPNPQTDFIFSVIGQELGAIGALIVLALLGLLIFSIFRVSQKTTSRFGALLCVGIASWLAAQVILNVGAVIGLLPVTGVPLPLISSGGSSLVVELFALGLVNSVAKRITPISRESGGQRFLKNVRLSKSGGSSIFSKLYRTALGVRDV